MSDLNEILFTTTSNVSQGNSCNAWNPSTGTNLFTYKGGAATNVHCLSMIKNEFIITANSEKPLLHIWPVNDQDQVPGTRYVTPGKVNALIISPDGHFIVAAIQESIYIWEICSGFMINSLSKHYQPITTIKFTDDGSHIISAGQDGCVLVWNFTLLSKCGHTTPEPIYAFNDHALSVSDLHVGNGGMRAIMATVSIDRTSRIYNLATGRLLLNLVFPDALTCVTIDVLETCIYTGTSTGMIYVFNIASPPRTQEYHMTKDDCSNKFAGHNGKAVTTLSLSLNGKVLCSGGHDENVHLWDIPTKQLLRIISQKGPVTNAFFVLCSNNILNSTKSFSLITSNLKIMMETTKNDHVVELLVPVSENEDDNNINTDITPFNNYETVHEIKKLENQVYHLKKLNKQLFDYSIDKVLDANF